MFDSGLLFAPPAFAASDPGASVMRESRRRPPSGVRLFVVGFVLTFVALVALNDQPAVPLDRTRDRTPSMPQLPVLGAEEPVWRGRASLNPPVVATIDEGVPAS